MHATQTLDPAVEKAATQSLPGASGWSLSYFDAQGRRHTSREKVPTNQNGEIVGLGFSCGKCTQTRWFPTSHKGVPVCPVHGRKMEPARLRGAPWLPLRELWAAVEKPLRPVWTLPALAVAGVAVDAAPIPAVALVGAAPVVGVLAKRVAQHVKAKGAVPRGRFAEDDPQGAERLRVLVAELRVTYARPARLVGYGAAAATAWLGLADLLDMAHSPSGAGVALAAAVAGWVAYAGARWRQLRTERDAPEVVEEPEPEPTADEVDPGEAKVREVWAARLAVKQGQLVDDGSGKPVPAPRAGKLVESWLEDWRRVSGGWAATAVGVPGVATAEWFLGARAAVASAFRMKASMVTVIPDADDETRALILAQRSSPIGDAVRWSGPDSIDVERGTAPVARYADGELATYEIYRPGWGIPHVAAFGSTGSGKSEFLNQLFTIDRWAHYLDADGQPHGLVANFLIDPQQGQSFAPFLDDLAAPVACTLDEAMILVRALTREMLRRNHYLAREAQTWDERRQKWRPGRKWWNPLIDGPILSLTIDEAHDFLSNREFATLVTKAGRMWRKCGGQIRIATHTPLLTDLGGSMALRDMLTSAFVWVGRTANSLSGPVAFNGRLPVDPRTIPQVPGTAYILTGAQPKAMLARTMWEPDYYDWIRDDSDRSIGFPAALPPETLWGLGTEFAAWVKKAGAGDDWSLEMFDEKPAPVEQPMKVIDAVFMVLAGASEPLDMNAIDAGLSAAGCQCSTDTARKAIAKLRADGLVMSVNRKHMLTAKARGEAEERQFAEQEQSDLIDGEAA